jgi:hypothetical protein
MWMILAAAGANAATFTFNSDPFAGTNVLNTPGRQVVGGELFINFNPATDVFAFDPSVFGIGNQIQFANDVANNLPTSNVNVIVLRSLDDDNNALTPFGAGNAATLIANQITTPGAGFFVYFNQGLNMPRLVFSTDLNDANADLRILARMLNLQGQSGALSTFNSANYTTTTPEPSSLMLIGSGWLCIAMGLHRRK